MLRPLSTYFTPRVESPRNGDARLKSRPAAPQSGCNKGRPNRFETLAQAKATRNTDPATNARVTSRTGVEPDRQQRQHERQNSLDQLPDDHRPHLLGCLKRREQCDRKAQHDLSMRLSLQSPEWLNLTDQPKAKQACKHPCPGTQHQLCRHRGAQQAGSERRVAAELADQQRLRAQSYKKPAKRPDGHADGVVTNDIRTECPGQTNHDYEIHQLAGTLAGAQQDRVCEDATFGVHGRMHCTRTCRDRGSR